MKMTKLALIFTVLSTATAALAGNPQEDTLLKRYQERFKNAKPATFEQLMGNSLTGIQNGYNGIWKCYSRSAADGVFTSSAIQVQFQIATNDEINEVSYGKSDSYFFDETGELQNISFKEIYLLKDDNYKLSKVFSKVSIRADKNNNLIYEKAYYLSPGVEAYTFSTKAIVSQNPNNLVAIADSYGVCEATISH